MPLVDACRRGAPCHCGLVRIHPQVRGRLLPAWLGFAKAFRQGPTKVPSNVSSIIAQGSGAAFMTWDLPDAWGRALKGGLRQGGARLGTRQAGQAHLSPLSSDHRFRDGTCACPACHSVTLAPTCLHPSPLPKMMADLAYLTYHSDPTAWLYLTVSPPCRPPLTGRNFDSGLRGSIT